RRGPADRPPQGQPGPRGAPMNAAIEQAGRRQEVREAAIAWKEAGEIDEATLREIVKLYPDDRVRLALWLRILAAVATFIGGFAVAALMAMLLSGNEKGWSVFCGVLAVVAALVTEWLTNVFRRSQGGIEEAVAALAVVFATLSIGFGFNDFDAGWILLAAAALCLIALWRWGLPV